MKLSQMRTDGGTQPRAELSWLNGLSPMAVFSEFTFLGHDAQVAQAIDKHCLCDGYIPFIDHADDLGWVFHSLCTPDGNISKKEIAARFQSAPQKGKEHVLETQLAHELRKQGHHVQRQVRCLVGIADIVTETAIYEIKDGLSSEKLFSAIGQVLLYREVINPMARAIVAGVASYDTESFRPAALAIGVEILALPEPDEVTP